MTDEDEAQLLREGRDRFAAAYEEDFWNRDEALDDLEFLVGEQWPENVKAEREEAGRPVLTINRMPQFLRQVTGDIRRVNPAIRVSAADGEADKDVAEIYEGLIRHIENKSDATTTYETAAESAAACGMGWFRILTDYESPHTFNQELRIERIWNPFAVYPDPEARDPTRKDARYMFVVERMTLERFEMEFPDAKPSSWESTGLPEYLSHWYDADRVLVAEYFCKKPVKKTIGMLEDGRVIDMDEPGAALRNVVDTREVEREEVHWTKMSGEAVLEGPVNLGTPYIPVIGVIGEETHIGDRLVRSSVIRYAKDAQRMYNYSRTALTEVTALQPKAPYMATADQVKGFEAIWESANRTNHPFLPYNSDPTAPPPKREAPPMLSSGLAQEVALAADDMKATTGIYDAALGERSNETSGVGIRQRQLESDISTSIYVDNLSKSIRQCGRVLVDLIPKVYDTTRQVRILGVDEQEKIITVNEPMRSFEGVFTVNDLSRGAYDVLISTGPNYSTKRQEAAESQIEFIRAVPNVAALVMDLIAENMDWPGAEQFAERLRNALPPGVRKVDVDEMSPEEQQAYMLEQQEAQQAKQLQMRAAMLEMAEKEATVQEKLAKTGKLNAEIAETEIDTAIRATELAATNGLIDQIAAQQTIAALTALGAQPAPQPGAFPTI